MRQVTFAPTFAGWQRAARTAWHEKWAPEEIMWHESDSEQPLLDLGNEPEAAVNPTSRLKVPKSFIDLATRVVCHSDPERWSLLYRALWRISHGEHELMQIMVDPDIHRLRQMEKAIRHDVHKMRAFVRFRAVEHEGATWYVAWFEPGHHIVELNAPFFVDRFASMCWSILTPDRCAHWDGRNLSFTKGVSRTEAPTEDATESLWVEYYSHIFNPARVKTRAMQAEMPKKYWKNLPEAAVISALLREAPARVNSMMAKSQAKKAAPADVHPARVPDTDKLGVCDQFGEAF
jgi:probable DNA metabolism protein